MMTVKTVNGAEIRCVNFRRIPILPINFEFPISRLITLETKMIVKLIAITNTCTNSLI